MTLRVAGASVRGPMHERLGKPNEDAWFARVTPRGALVVVADGMGSRPAAREGSRAAVAACRTAFGHWRDCPDAKGEDLVKLIEVLWRLKLGRTPHEEACTTCLVGALRPDGTGVALQLGDGLLGVRDRAGEFHAVTPERQGFATTTVALGTPHGLRDWAVAPLPRPAPGTILLLASDGIADDVAPEKRAALAGWVVSEAEGSRRPRRKLAQALRAWPTPKHQDDKTIVAAWEAMP